MNRNVIIGIVLAIVALGGGGYLYWDDIVNVIPEDYRSYIPGYVAPAPPVVQATDTAAAAGPTVEEYREKVAAIFDAVAQHEGLWLYGDTAWGYSTTLKTLAITYPENSGQKNINVSGKMIWTRIDDWSMWNWRVDLEGNPYGEVNATNSEGTQLRDVGGSKNYEGSPVCERLWYELSNPLWLLPVTNFDLPLSLVEEGEEGTVRLVFANDEAPGQGFYAVRSMTMEVRSEEDNYELVSYTLKLFVDGKIRTHSIRWEKAGDNYILTTDQGRMEVESRTSEGMVLACAGTNPTRYTFAYGEHGFAGVSIALTREDVTYEAELSDVEPLIDPPGEKFLLGAEYKEPDEASVWAQEKMGWRNPGDVAAPTEDSEDENDTGTASPTEVSSSETEDGTDAGRTAQAVNAQEEGDEEEQPAETAQAARPAPAPASAEAEEEEEEEEAPAPAPAPRPAPQPAPRPQPAAQPARQATTATAAAPATGGTAVARPAAPAPYTQAVTAYRGGNLRLAEQKLQQTLRQSPNHAGANYLLGYIYYTRGNYSAAHTYLSRTWRQTRDRQLAAQAQQLLHRMGYPY